MHWSLIALIQLCIGCAILNFVQWRITGQVRITGLMICGVWIWQQAWWVITGTDNLPLWVTCDILMLWFLWRRASDWSDWVIAGMLVCGMAIYIPQFAFGETITGWWAVWALVAAEMVLGLPRAGTQKITGSVSHGRLRNAGGE